MMDRTSPVRRQTRVPVRWPVLYGCDEFVSEGTVLDVTPLGWKVAGSMPVHPGMRLTIQLWPQDKPERIRVEQATVLWVKGCEFALDVPELAPDDRAWITEFLNQKLSLWLIREAKANQPLQTSNAEPFSTSNQIVRASEIAMTQVREEVIQRCMAQSGCTAQEANRAFQRVHGEALRIVNGMRARKALRDLTGQDSITNN